MADIVLKDRNGNSIEYPGVNHIKVKTTDGATRDFVDSETVPEVLEDVPIALDFSGGDQEIVAPDGMVVKSAIIQQPATLIPENIAEGVDISGIIGTLAVGGSGSVVVASGTFAGSGASNKTIEHGLGVIPDLVVVSPAKYSSMVNNDLATAVHWSSAIQQKYGTDFCGVQFYKNGSYYSFTVSTSGIESNTSGMHLVADKTNITVTQRTTNGRTYIWIAIGGLT